MLKEKFKKILILSILSIMMFNFIGTNVVYANLDDEMDGYNGYLPGSSSNNDGYVWGDLDAEQQAQQGDTSIITPGSTVDPNTGQVIRPSNGSTSTSTSDDPTLSTVSNKTQILKENEIAKQIGSGLSTIADGIVGIYTYFERLKIVILGGVLQFLGAVVGESAGSMNTGTVTFITPDSCTSIFCIRKLSLQETLICSTHIYLVAKILILHIIINQLVHQFYQHSYFSTQISVV